MESGKIDMQLSDDSKIKNHIEEAPAEKSKVLIGSSKNLIETKLQNGDVNTEERLKLTVVEKNLENYGSGDFNTEVAKSPFAKPMYTATNIKTDLREEKKNTDKSEIETSFYGINIPAGSVVEEEINPVYTDQKEVLKVMKRCKGARFKVFKSETEALEFANSQSEQSTASRGSDPLSDVNSTTTGERTLGFRTPKNQDLVRLRKSIECGDMENVTETIWSNPRYLVSSGDTPTILQEGSRYNALHVSAKMKQYEIAKLILSIVESEKFMQLLYNDDNETTCLQRVNFLTDLYLNTPDKGLCETPLHFACKFGSLEIVFMLVNHPLCDLNLKNKYGQTAKELICTRCPKENPELKSAIEDCFNNRFYVPVLRTADNTKLPSIGKPYSPSLKKPLLLTNIPDNPIDLPLSVKAYAGPMSPTQAAEFHKRITTPVRSKLNRSIGKLDVRLSDADKGLERIGRALSNEMEVAWSEYWPFLKCYCNLSTPEGLAQLELFLKNQYNEMMAEESVKRSSEKDSYQALNLNSTSDGISSICEALRNLHLDSKSSYSSENISPIKTNTSECICPKSLRCHSGPASFRDSNTSLNMDAFLQRTCEVIGDQIFAESARFSQALEEEDNLTLLLNPHKSFGKAILPYVKCLYDIAARLADDLTARDNFNKVHLNVARHVQKMVAMNDDNNMRKLFRVLTLPDTDLVILSDLSDDEIGFCNERVQRAKRKQNKKFLVNIMGNHLKCMLQMLSVKSKAENENETEENVKCECYCDWTVYKNEDQFDELFDEVVCSDRNVSKPINVPSVSEDSSSISKSLQSAASDVSTDLYFTPDGSLKSSRCDSMSEAYTPDEGLAVFIDGSTPAKIDIDVMRAIETVGIDPILYPNIYRYKFFMNTRMQEQGESFSDSFEAFRPISFRPLNHPLTSTPSCSYTKKMFFDKTANFNPFKDKNNGNYLQSDLFQE